MIVCGLDLSLTSSGVALVTDESEVELHRIRTTGADEASLMDRHRRLVTIRNRVLASAAEADVVVVEGPAYGVPAQRGRHDLAGLWWLVVAALHHLDRPTVVVSPKTRAKFATDNGNASKVVVREAVRRMWPLADVRSYDEADALVLATTAAVRYRFPVPFNVLERHRQAIGALPWPQTEHALQEVP